ncbi:ABC transporter permease [Actinoplanes sp. NBRC 101535]|uniref:ABC transporter permease n=1 Tax=Actinoplanes sp. NBRC 101535 TaxID=3032196 RepID=UPI0024A129E2|nr:ABC transporter permease [Actinoplanes sp. NBRC 101535]GLY06255.1 ABC transporter [Actinoplanes sp. NBRC 101535]
MSALSPAVSRPVTLGRLTVVELRKLADTRAGLWLLIVIVLATAGTSVLQLGWADESEQSFPAFFLFGQVPSAVLLPVLGILSVTSEWSQRTVLGTFTLVPARGRVLGAKVVAGVLISVAATALAAILAAVATVIAGPLGGAASWRLEPSLIGQSLLLQAVFVLMGIGFGTLLLSTPLAIVVFFALPTVWSVLGSVVKSLSTASEWLDLNFTSQALTNPDMTGGEWSRLAVSATVWVVIPLVAGVVRVLRQEVS